MWIPKGAVLILGPALIRGNTVTAVFKKKDPLHKTNYCPVSVLPTVSKLFEKIMQKQVNGL